MLLRRPRWSRPPRGTSTIRLRRRGPRRRQRRAVRRAHRARGAARASSCSSARRATFAAATAGTRATSAARTASQPAVLTGAYTEDEFLADLLRVNGGTDRRVARAAWSIQQSATCPEWMARDGVRFQAALRGTLHLGRTNAFFLGGGKALMNSYYAAAERLGIDVLYDADVVDLRIARRPFRIGRRCTIGGRRRDRARRVGGARVGRIRVEPGVAARGVGRRRRQLHHPRHAVQHRRAAAADARRRGAAGRRPARVPRHRRRRARAEIRRRHRHPARLHPARDRRQRAGPSVLRRGRGRLAEALRDLGNARRATARRRSRIAIVDAKAAGTFMPSVFPPIVANSIGELARPLEPASRTRSRRPWTTFNARRAARPFDLERARRLPHRGPDAPTRRTGRSGSTRRRSGPIRCGPASRSPISGVAVDAHARVADADGQPAANVYAAGEIMAGNILREGYLAGFGMTIGTVFGRIAGEEAAGMLPDDLIRRDGAAHDDGLQRLPLLRAVLPGVPGDGEAADLRCGRSQLSREPVPQLRRVPLRLSVRAAARVRHQRALVARGHSHALLRGLCLAAGARPRVSPQRVSHRSGCAGTRVLRPLLAALANGQAIVSSDGSATSTASSRTA